MKLEERFHSNYWKCAPRSAMYAFILILMYEANRWRASAVTFKTHSSEFCFSSYNVWHWRIGKCTSRLILASEVRKWGQVVFYYQHSLHLWKRYLAVRLQQDSWRTCASRLQYDVGPGSHSNVDIVRLLTRSSCTELQPSANVSIWVVWLSAARLYQNLSEKSWAEYLELRKKRQHNWENYVVRSFKICTRRQLLLVGKKQGGWGGRAM